MSTRPVQGTNMIFTAGEYLRRMAPARSAGIGTPAAANAQDFGIVSLAHLFSFPANHRASKQGIYRGQAPVTRFVAPRDKAVNGADRCYTVLSPHLGHQAYG